MPPRHAYWTILIDDKPTAFRAREREELQPTFVQLQRKNTNVSMRWFARGKLWDSREAERDDFQAQRHAADAPREPRGDRPPAPERRGSEWRPGGTHKDPRDRFKKKNRPERAWSEKDPATQRDRDKPGYVARKPWQDKPRGDRPWPDKKPGGEGKRPWTPRPPDRPGPPRDDRAPSRSSSERPRTGGGWQGKPSGPPRERKPWSDKPAPPNDRPWQTKPTGPRAQRKPWVGKPSGDGARSDRPWQNKAGGEGKRPWTPRPPDRSGPPRERKPWQDKPAGGPPRGDRPWSSKPPDRFGPPPARKPWQDKPAGGPPRGDRPPDRRSSSDRPRGEGGWKKPVGAQGFRPAKPGGDRPWSSRPPDRSGPPRERKPWQDKPAGGAPRGSRPGGSDRPPRKRRDDDPDRD